MANGIFKGQKMNKKNKIKKEKEKEIGISSGLSLPSFRCLGAANGFPQFVNIKRNVSCSAA
jgi:hypothetical protein